MLTSDHERHHDSSRVSLCHDHPSNYATDNLMQMTLAVLNGSSRPELAIYGEIDAGLGHGNNSLRETLVHAPSQAS